MTCACVLPRRHMVWVWLVVPSLQELLSCLQLACFNGHIDIVAWLLGLPSDPARGHHAPLPSAEPASAEWVDACRQVVAVGQQRCHRTALLTFADQHTRYSAVHSCFVGASAGAVPLLSWLLGIFGRDLFVKADQVWMVWQLCVMCHVLPHVDLCLASCPPGSTHVVPTLGVLRGRCGYRQVVLQGCQTWCRAHLHPNARLVVDSRHCTGGARSRASVAGRFWPTGPRLC